MKIDLCEYDKEGWPPAVHQELIRDKFIFGLADDSLKERLLREADVSLAKAVETVQRVEWSKKQVKGTTKPAVNSVQESEQIQKKKSPDPRTRIALNVDSVTSPRAFQRLARSVHNVRNYTILPKCAGIGKP